METKLVSQLLDVIQGRRIPNKVIIHKLVIEGDVDGKIEIFVEELDERASRTGDLRYVAR